MYSASQLDLATRCPGDDARTNEEDSAGCALLVIDVTSIITVTVPNELLN
jgi:hypothetical protein